MVYARITATSSVLPERNIPNSHFSSNKFYINNEWREKTPDEIFEVTGINNRLWAKPEETDFDYGVRALGKLWKETGSEADCIIYCFNGIHSNGSYSPIPAKAAMLQYAVDQAGQNLAVDVLIDLENKKDIVKGLERRYPTISYIKSDFKNIKIPEQFDKKTKEKVKPASNLILVDHQGYLAEHSMAWEIKKELCLTADTYEVIAGCAGFLVGCDFGAKLIEQGIYTKVDVIGIELLTKIADPDNLDLTLYADGGGAVRLERSAEPGFIDSLLCTDGSDWSLLRLEKSIRDELDKTPDDKISKFFIKMQGREIYHRAKNAFPRVLSKLLQRNHLSVEDVAVILIHQMNGRMLHFVAGNFFNIDKEEAIDKYVPYSVNNNGNSSTGTIPTVLDMVLRKELKRYYSKKDFGLALGSGKLAATLSFGAGLTWGGGLLCL